jgi:hypothetical protein
LSGGAVEPGKLGYEANHEEHKDNLKRIAGELGTSATHKWFFDLIGGYSLNLQL